MKIKTPLALLLASALLAGCAGLKETGDGSTSTSTRAKKGPVLNYSLTELKEIDLTADEQRNENESIWQRITNNYQLDQGVPPRIQREIDFYRTRPKTLPEVFNRSKPYLFMIVDELDKRNMPMEIALLPVIESAFHPRALSEANASGMWQFTPDTAQVRGIKNNWWFDGRRDVYLSTMAALDYLQSLNKRFDGDWLHTLAAYNAGAITVRNAINKNKAKGKSTDYWNLELPGETQRYVPKLLAVAKMIQAPESYRLNLPDIPNVPYLTRIEVDQQIDLATAAQMAEMSWEDFHRFNAGHKRIATDPSGTSHVLVPIDKLRTFAVNLTKFAPQTNGNWISHTCGLNDTLETLSTRYETTPEMIVKINRLTDAQPKVGQSLLIPCGQTTLDSNTETQAQSILNSTLSLENREKHNKIIRDERRELANKPKIMHTLAKGQTLNSVATYYHIPLKTLVTVNRFDAKTQLKAGQQLIIPIERINNVVSKKGDTWQTLGNQHGIAPALLAEFNQSNIKSTIKQGQVVRIPKFG
jgi:membrane-bound lytic murein transglycosylase D